VQIKAGFAKSLFPNLVNAGSLTRYKSSFAARYDDTGWSVGWDVRYIGGARVLGADPSAPFNRASGIFYHDVNGKVRFNALTIRFGVDNLFNQTPPTLIDGTSNTNLNTYDVIGRYFYLRAALTL